MLHTHRGWFKFYFLTCITFGIYALCFWATLAKETNKACEGDGKHTKRFLIAILLSLVTFGIYGLVWQFKLYARLFNYAENHGIQTKGSIVGYILNNTIFVEIVILPIIALKRLCKLSNRIFRAYNEAQKAETIAHQE